MKLKRLLAIVCAAALAVTMTACKKEEKTPETTSGRGEAGGASQTATGGILNYLVFEDNYYINGDQALGYYVFYADGDFIMQTATALLKGKYSKTADGFLFIDYDDAGQEDLNFVVFDSDMLYYSDGDYSTAMVRATNTNLYADTLYVGNTTGGSVCFYENGMADYQYARADGTLTTSQYYYWIGGSNVYLIGGGEAVVFSIVDEYTIVSSTKENFTASGDSGYVEPAQTDAPQTDAPSSDEYYIYSGVFYYIDGDTSNGSLYFFEDGRVDYDIDGYTYEGNYSVYGDMIYIDFDDGTTTSLEILTADAIMLENGAVLYANY